MDHRCNEPEFDELEKLLGEIPRVTSENHYNPFPLSLSSTRSPSYIKKTTRFEEQKLHDDQEFTSAFSNGNLNFGTGDQTPENHQLMFIPSYHSQDSSHCVNTHMLRKVQHGGYCPNLSPGISPAKPQPYIPRFDHNHAFNRSFMNWRNLDEGSLQRMYLQEEQYMAMNNQSMDTAPRQEYFGYSRAEEFNRSLFRYGGSCEESVKKMRNPEKILMRSHHGLNTAKFINYGVGDDPLWLPNQLNEDLAMGLNNLALLPTKYISLEEARGKICHMAKDQHGCRFLQGKFAEGNENDIEMIFNEIINHISELMIDPFGNYLVQKLLEVCNEAQRMMIVHCIARKPGVLIKISCDMHGTRAVQKIVETIKRHEEVAMIVSALKHGIVTLIKNVNGNHVVQRCLQYLMPHCGKFLFDAAMTHCVELATDRHGCCVLQKCLACFEVEQKDHLVFVIASNALLLSQDPFGNYVLQYVFELQHQWATNEILEQLGGNYTKLSMQKCSSNVIEKCLKLADKKHRALIIGELINYGRLDQVMLDPYGNYVVQAALKLSKGSLHVILVDVIKLHISSLRTNPYGKKVLSVLSSSKK